MYKCRIDRGKMIFTDEMGKTYSPGGLTYESIREITDENKLLVKILNDHAWAFPVVEAVNRRRDALKQNLMDLMTRKENGRNIQHSEDAEAASVAGGKGAADTDRGRKAAPAEKVAGQK